MEGGGLLFPVITRASPCPGSGATHLSLGHVISLTLEISSDHASQRALCSSSVYETWGIAQSCVTLSTAGSPHVRPRVQSQETGGLGSPDASQPPPPAILLVSPDSPHRPRLPGSAPQARRSDVRLPCPRVVRRGTRMLGPLGPAGQGWEP